MFSLFLFCFDFISVFVEKKIGFHFDQVKLKIEKRKKERKIKKKKMAFNDIDQLIC